MPTVLPERSLPEPEPDRDPGWRDVLFAGAVLLSALALLAGNTYPPLAGYALNRSPTELQLSP